MNDSAAAFAAAPWFQAIYVEGKDADRFLNNQCTSKFEADSQATGMSAWLNAKGRVICNFYFVRTAAGYLLFVHSTMADSFVSGLQRFIFRDKVSIRTASEATVCAGLGPLPEWIHQDKMQADTIFTDAGFGLMLPGPGKRWLLALEAESAQESVSAESAPPEAFSARWLQRDIEAGSFVVDADRSENFLAQNLNLDALGAISFDKGCYPGQEIVARVKYRGRVKSRMFRARGLSAELNPNGAAIMDTADQSKVGELLCQSTGGDMLITLDLDSAGATLAFADFPDRHILPGELPYPVED